MSIPEKKFIDIWLQTYPADNPDRKTYQPYKFYTYEDYTHEELKKIMTENIQQKWFLNKDNGYMEIDLRDLNNQLNAYKISVLFEYERYYFDIEE